MADRTTARLVGVLFIVATVAAIVGGSMVAPVMADSPAATPGIEARVVSGVLLELLLVLAVIGIATLLFPVLRRVDEGLALTYVAARTVEAILLLAASIAALAILAVGDDLVAADARPVITLVQVTRDVSYLVGSMIALGVGAVILYGLLLRGRLVPAWLSVWGLIGGVAILVRGVAELYGVEFAVPAQAVLAAPIAVNEMVLAVRLIARGFDRPAPVAVHGRGPQAVGA
jgi:hypothetical protein